jgi:hypothetical protein
MSRRCYDIKLVDGPQAGQLVPVRGSPLFGFCLELDRFVPGAWNRSPRTFTDIYKISHNPSEAIFVGTLR